MNLHHGIVSSGPLSAMQGGNNFHKTPVVPLNRHDLLSGSFLLYMPIGEDGLPSVFYNAVRFEAFTVAMLPDNGIHRHQQMPVPFQYPDNVWFTHGLVLNDGKFYSAPAALSSLGGIISILNQHQISRMSILDIIK